MEVSGDFDTPPENKQYPVKCRFDKYENSKFGKTRRDRWMESLKEEEETEDEEENRSEGDERKKISLVTLFSENFFNYEKSIVDCIS